MIRLLILLFFLSVEVLAVDSYQTLQAGGQTYSKVVVLSVSESSLSIRHARGISQVALSDLSLELQQKYGYDPAQAANREAELAALRRQQALAQSQQIAQAKAARSNKGSVRSRGVFAQFGSEPELQAEVDLRARFRSHGIRIRNQSGPSCSVHATLAALEYQYAEQYGRVVNLSEDYLVSATSRSLGRPDAVGFDQKTGRRNGSDLGFALEQVFQAIHGHGLAIERTAKERAADSPYTMVQEAMFRAFIVPGGNSEIGLDNIVHVLNAQTPVVVGVSWPRYSKISHTSLLSKQPVDEGQEHAVTIVGYRCEDGKIENAKFIFRNSWGDDWGAGGYGFFTYEYLRNHLLTCYVVELD